MISLPDVNALVALFDPHHVHHTAIHGWFAENREEGWATCPLTENGLIRIVSNPKYPGRKTTVTDAVERLARFRKSGHHTFWRDTVSCCDPGRIAFRHVLDHRQLTDVYLLALAVENRGRLVTLDRSIRTDAVEEATPDHLLIVTV